MKTCLNAVVLSLVGLFAGTLMAPAAGNTSIVHLSEVQSVKVEPGKVTIIGTGHVEFRIMTDREPANSSVFGQPAQLVRAVTTRGTFEIIPYFSDPKIKGVPTGGHDADELKKLSKQWWEDMKGGYAKVRAGDSVTIRYQEDQITLSEFRIQKIIGAGSLTIHPIPPTAKQPGGGQTGGEVPATLPESK